MRAFARQTWPARELIVVHDGGDALHHEIAQLAAQSPDAVIRVVSVPAGRTLGALRNHSIDEARGTFVCQWDDDDLYHPARIERQVACLRAAGAECCFLTDQMHLFADTGEMYWDDWTVEPPPQHLIQGTLLGYRDALPRYQDVARGEDTRLVIEIARRGAPIAELRDAGWLYVYVYDGQNVFERTHHAAISAWKRRPGATLVARREELLARLREHEWPVPLVFMPHEHGRLHVVLPPRTRA